jgi:hypothetical protein
MLGEGGSMGRRAGLAALIALAGVAVAAVAVAEARSSHAAAPCSPAPVQYGGNGFLARETAPWISAGTGRERLTGFLYTHEPNLGDARVRTASGYTVHAGRQVKIAWAPRSLERISKTLVVNAKRLDGRGSFTRRFPRALTPAFFPSGLTLPTAGCWRLSLRSGDLRWTFDVRALEAPAAPRCDTNAVRTGRHPVDGTIAQWVELSPRSSGISGTFSVSIPGVPGAAIHAGGRWPNGANTKVLWITRAPWDVLRLQGTRLDAEGAFEQTARAANASAPGGFYPSIVVVPDVGCWLLRARSGPRGGVLVIRALPPG